MKVAMIPVGLFKADWKIYVAFFLRQLGGNAIWAIWPLYQAGIGATKLWIALVEVTNMVGQIIFMSPGGKVQPRQDVPDRPAAFHRRLHRLRPS
jgi:hypothetical protein